MKSTAVRANKSEINSTVNNTTYSPSSKTVCATPNKNQLHNVSSAIAKNSTQQNVSFGEPSVIPSTTPTTNITTLSNSSFSGVISTQNQLPLVVTSSTPSILDENHSHANKTISTPDQLPSENSKIATIDEEERLKKLANWLQNVPLKGLITKVIISGRLSDSAFALGESYSLMKLHSS